MKKSDRIKACQVLCAFAEPARGPGWSNQPIWYIFRSTSGELIQGCLQPKDHTREMAALYRVSAEVHAALTAAVARKLEGEK
jgi:hypothetical protein